MERVASAQVWQSRPEPAAVLELLKPITWFPPMWAFGCGVASVPAPEGINWLLLISGILLTGPLVCGTSQAVNDWFDRHVDAINEPNRPIPSGRVPGHWGLFIAIAWSLVSLVVATALGTFGFLATCCGLILAWAYSAPPIRLKLDGWWGNLAVGACYEGLPWVTGAAVMSATATPGSHILLLAFLYSVGAHGIMTLNDFKSIEGDLRMGIASLPAQLGAPLAAGVACIIMIVPQILVVVLLLFWGKPWHAAAVSGLVIAQILLMQRLLQKPRELAPWYNATGISLYVSGMLISAFAVRGLLTA
jgi:chlorophyll/bacteriochlorophyll a synthase